MGDLRSAPPSMGQVRNIGRTRHRDGTVTVYVPGPVHNDLVQIAERAHEVAKHPYGSIPQRAFYALRESLAAFYVEYRDGE